MPTLTIPEQLRATAQRLRKRNNGFICHELSCIVTNDAGQTARWHVTSDKNPVNARIWWDAINQVKCMNHKLRTAPKS